MEKTKIKIPRRIPEKDWEVHIPEDLGTERKDMEDIEAYKTRLERLGFECIHTVESLPLENLKKRDETENTTEHSLWYHPVGVLLTIKSYQNGGYYSDFENKYLPIKKKLGSAHAYFCADIGCGPEIQHIAYVKNSSSGGWHHRPDGSLFNLGYDYFHQNTGTGLTDFMETTQAIGRFLPVSKWGGVGARMPYLPKELLSPILPGQPLNEYHLAIIDGNTDKQAELHDKLLVQFLERLPGSIGAELLLLSQAQMDTSYNTIYDDIEEGMKHYSETMFLAGKRWMNPQESELLTLWAAAATGRIDDEHHWRIEEVGPARLSLGAVLAMADEKTGSMEKLLDLVKRVDVQLLSRWCTQPDEAGFTLPLIIMRDLLRNKGRYTVQPEYDDSIVLETLNVLVERLGPKGLVLNTDKRSILGLLAEFVPNGSASARILETGHRRFSQALETLDRAGVEWNHDLKWRSYPNIMTDKVDPCFYSIPGVVQSVELRGILQDRWTEQLSGIAQKLDALAAREQLSQEPPNPKKMKLK